MSNPNRSSTTQLREYLETKKGKTYLISAITLITVAIMLVFAIVPALTSITDKIAQNRERREYLEALTLKEQTIKDLITQEEANPLIIQQLEKALQNTPNDEYILANIGKFTEMTGTKLIAADYKEKTGGNILDVGESQWVVYSAPITLSVQGNIANLSQFLRRIESFPLIIEVESFSYNNTTVQSQDLNPANGKIILNLNLNYYYLQNAAI